jgi:2,3-bisphosphoglycerate-independent phosphoglycerate mutase
MNKKVLLMILDGWGVSPNPAVSAIDQANTPFIDGLYKTYQHATLRTDGMHVGLPEGQMGNSEVGHMNLGAGRIVYQDLAKVNLAVSQGTLAQEEVIKKAFNYAKVQDKPVHFLGLLSDGGVHAHIKHIKALVDAGEAAGIRGYIHGFTDGRDVDPKSGAGFIQDLSEHCAGKKTQLATLVGRYYAMDRDKRWERVKIAYDALVHHTGTFTDDFVGSLKESYQQGVTDEFIQPLISNQVPEADARIKEGDVVFFFNFRTDRGRELTQVLSQEDFHEQNMHKMQLYFVTLTNYDESFQNIEVVFNKDNIEKTLGEVIADFGKTQIRIAETEKYPHVTFFFNGGRETPYAGESRILCPSPKVATYDLQPEMSAFDIRDAIVPELQNGAADFVCLNFANPDMVGHTGDLAAAIKACEVVDSCAHSVIDAALSQDYSVLVIADHGNCDTMINPDGTPNTAHTTNPVPFILVEREKRDVKSGVLGDIAPTILDLMGIPQPELMTGKSLLA